MIAVLCRVDLRNKGLVKGELKTKIINFSNIFFGKPNIEKLSLWSYFFPFLVICEKITLEVELFPLFLAFSSRAQKLGQQHALTYDMGNRDFAIK